MKIKKLTIDNFRSIEHAEYQFKDINIFEGANDMGKSNTIDSIMWVLSNETMSNGKDDKANLNKDNSKLEIFVELELENGKTFSRRFSENWLARKGEIEKIYNGVINNYFVNGTKLSYADYYDEVIKTFEIRYDNKVKDINIIRTFIDPLYLSSIDYKVRRKFFEKILKLESDETIVNEVEQFREIGVDLALNGYDIAKTSKMYRDSLNGKNGFNEKIVRMESEIRALTSEEFDEREYLTAKEDLKIAREKDKWIENIEIQETRNKINELTVDLANSKAKDIQKLSNEELLNTQMLFSEKCAEIEKTRTNGNDLVRERDLLKIQADNIKVNGQSKNDLIASHSKEIELLKAKTFELKTCPNCKFVLNESESKTFEDTKNSKINNLTKEIKTLTEEKTKLLEEYGNIVAEANKIGTKINEVAKEYSTQIKARDELQVKIDELTKKSNEVLKSEKTIELETLIENLSIKLSDLIKLDCENKMKHSTEVSIEIEELQGVYDQLNVLKTNNDTASNYAVPLQELINSKCSYERKQIILKKFNEYKIQILSDTLFKVFGNDLQLCMLEESKLTEGSYQETCYFTENGVPFNELNTSKKYIIGIKAIEKLKTFLKIGDLPLVIDLLSEIDMNNSQIMFLKLTNSQVFSTRVIESGFKLTTIDKNETNKNDAEVEKVEEVEISSNLFN